ncbi:tetratricopeptide repeat protein [Actinophytocola algeriensis]|uniref:Tetratricopeptide (TPR) repeat protein n=1 Tax=Actinophytocola algeriensis TaxID=1768010 RepID=A0A7W7Q9T5_9PSEU|nr:tetratricopeptide repeat protein [Actinophytocola algeriensis]MBB4909528.1 tetratricopeptide (TPR) repeat protein [Actinophytocola algeriensis]MBE1475518.1 tetratricopeptide (TPR) repeat protein [Actinophytocola algeriensis]
MTAERGGEDQVPVRNEVSGWAHNVVQARHIDKVYLSSPGSPVADGQVVVGPVPREPQHFQRREQVGELARLAGAGAPAVVCAVTGQRGVGKTQLVGAYARQRIRDGWLTAWIPGETADAVAAGLGELADALGLRREGEDDATVLVRVRNLLQTRRDPALLVFDNVTDPEHVTPYLPATGSTQIVLTSASHAVERLGTRVPVDLFSPDTATRFLSGSTGIQDEAGARELAAKLGHLPLALAQAAARIARPPRAGDYGTYLRLLEDVSLEQALTARSGDPYPLGAAEAVLLAVEPFLAQETAAELAVLDLLGVLSPDGVSRALLDVDDDLLNRLFEASLIEFAGGPGDAVVVMHRLTQRVLRERANHDLPSVVARAAHLLNEATFASQEAWQRRDQGDELVRHIDALWEHRSPPVIQEVLVLRRWAVRQLDHAMAADRAVRLAEEVHADHRRLCDDDDPGRLGALLALATTCQRTGRLDDAIQLHEQGLAATRRFLGDEDPNVLIAAGNLSSAYREAGRLDEAITLLERTLPAARRMLGDDHETTQNTTGQLAAAYQRAGRVADAIRLFQQVFTSARRMLGDDDLFTLDAADSLACAHHAAHEPDTAIEHLEPVLAAGRRRHGDNHPFTLRAASNLAGMYGAAGRLDEAIPLYERILGDQRRLFGDHDLDAFFTANSLVDTYRTAGRLEEATRLAEQNLADRRQVLGDNHPDTLDSAAMLAHVHLEAGRHDEAIRLYEQTLATRRRVMGDDHPDTISAAASLGLAYHDAGRADDAMTQYERTLADSRRVHGEDHEVTRALTAALADWYRSAGRPDQEVPLRAQIFVTARRLRGDTHPDTVGAAGNLAVAYLEGGRPDLAIPYLERAFSESEKTHGGADARTLTLGHNLACAYRDAGRQDEATVLFRRTGIIAMRTLGKDNPLTQAARNHLRPPTDGDSKT